MRVIDVETITHGRVLVEDAAVDVSRGWLIGFHGYGQSADDMFAELQRLNADGAWSIAAPQALHRFYTRGDERVVASWMTRQDRDLAVADNVEYCNRLLGSGLALQHRQTAVSRPLTEVQSQIDGPLAPALVFIGFSQGAAMAYRAAALGRFPARAVISLAGDIPPEVRAADAGMLRRQIGRVLIGAGARDTWFTPAKVDADAAFLASAGVPHAVERFDGRHEWTDAFRRAAGRVLDALSRGREESDR
jgi:predicted esterase